MPHALLRRVFRDSFSLYLFVKYTTFSFLFVNVILFLIQELNALEHTFTYALSLSQFIQVFSATIDTGSWFLLLLLFEIETTTKLFSNQSQRLKSLIYILKSVCYLAICYAFVGYYYELITILDVQSITKKIFCDTPNEWSLLVDVDEYVSLTSSSCKSFSDNVVQISTFNVVVPTDNLLRIQYLTLVDVINAGAWILIVLLLELDVFMLARKKVFPIIRMFSFLFKMVLYITLFAAAIYWGINGNFLDFWDASLWLFAFIFIELNVFQWRSSGRKTLVTFN